MKQGCPKCFMQRNRGNTKGNWKGFGEISGDHWSVIKRAAKLRNLEFDISIKEAWELFLSQNKKCALTGWPLNMHESGSGKWTASLDRIDSSIGYIPGNVQWLHNDINKMKLHHSTQRFYEICNSVVEHANKYVVGGGR